MYRKPSRKKKDEADCSITNSSIKLIEHVASSSLSLSFCVCSSVWLKFHKIMCSNNLQLFVAAKQACAHSQSTICHQAFQRLILIQIKNECSPLNHPE